MPDLSELLDHAERLSPTHRRIFNEWAGCDDGTGFHFKALERRTGLSKKEIRPIVRDLAKEGFLSFLRGCFTEEGEAYGSAYVLTVEGWKVLHALRLFGRVEVEP